MVVVMVSGVVMVRVAMRMLVMRMVVMVVAVMVVAVRAALRFEAGVLEAQGKPEATHHVVEHVVVLIGESSDADLKRNVPVTEMVRRTCEQEWVVGRRHAQGFVGGDDFVRFALVGEQAIAVREDGSARELHGDFLAVFEKRSKPRLLAGVVTQNQP